MIGDSHLDLLKNKVHLHSIAIATWVVLSSQTWLPFNLGHSPSTQTRSLWPTALQPYVALFCHLVVSCGFNLCKKWPQ